MNKFQSLFRKYYASVFKSIHIKMDEKQLKEIIEKNTVHPWFFYGQFKQRRDYWNSWEASLWIKNNFTKTVDILETGCGCGLNLIWFAQRGYKNLTGFDISLEAVNAGIEIIHRYKYPIKIERNDALDPVGILPESFDVIMALNWCYLLDAFDLHHFFRLYGTFLKKDGALLVDFVDQSYDRSVKPGQGSEYKKRYAPKEVVTTAADVGMQLVKIVSHPQEVPKKLYIFKK